MPTCPACGDEFDTRRGLGVHHSSVHDERKRRALERDDRECVLCGVGTAEIGRNPDVHHIVPVRVFLETPVTTERDAHYLGNLACLCPSCHRRAEFGSIGTARVRAAIAQRP